MKHTFYLQSAVHSLHSTPNQYLVRFWVTLSKPITTHTVLLLVIHVFKQQSTLSMGLPVE